MKSEKPTNRGRRLADDAQVRDVDGPDEVLGPRAAGDRDDEVELPDGLLEDARPGPRRGR
ncbi:MAG: hypothetical protein M0C28_20910 [Candidatus Moduliflexus flocculans]|nr:hypothetical protein [Candidatus Moduliflexus flocculans]